MKRVGKIIQNQRESYLLVQCESIEEYTSRCYVEE